MSITVMLDTSKIVRSGLYKKLNDPLTDVSELTFSKKKVWRKFMLYHPRFTIHEDDFNLENFYYQVVKEIDTTKEYTNGRLRITSTGGGGYYALYEELKYPFIGAIMKINTWSWDGTNLVHASCGLISIDDQSRLFIVYTSENNGEIRLVERANGTNTVLLSKTIGELKAPVWLMVIIHGKWISGYYSWDGENWTYIGTASLSGHDIRDDSIRSSLYPYFGGGGEGGNYVEVDYVKFFVPVGVGYKDVKIITDIYGNPIVRNGKYYLGIDVATGVGDDDVAGSGAHYVIFEFDPQTLELEPVSMIFTRREGKTLGDHAGQIVYDTENKKWLIVLSSWGDHDITNTVKVVKGETYENLLKGVHIINVEVVDIGVTTAYYDPSIIKQGDYYYIVCAVTNAVSPPWDFGVYVFRSSDMQTWEQVASYTPEPYSEGPNIVKIGSNWYVCSSKGTDTMAVLTFPDLAEVRTISVPTGHTNPWGGIFPIFLNGKTRYYILAMDKIRAKISGTELPRSWGALHIYVSEQEADGYEYPLPQF